MLRLRSEEKCLSQGGSARSELGNFCLFISLSTGRLNTRWLSHMWTSQQNHHWPRGQSAGYNIYMYRNKMK